MKTFKHINQLVLLSFFMSSVSVGTVSAAPSVEGVFKLFKNILSFEYLNGERGEYRNRPIHEKIVNQPGRTLVTAAVLCGTAWIAKKLFDLAQKHGVFDEVRRPAARPYEARPMYQEHPQNQERPANRANINRPNQNQRPSHNRPNRPAYNQPNRPNDVPNNVHNARFAAPFEGRQLNILGLNLPGFYHMESQTPYHAVHNACGVNAAYNMANVEARLFGQRLNVERFREVQRAIFPAMGGRGASNREVEAMMARMGLAEMTLLLTNRQNLGGINARARTFRNTQGPRVAHFLCQVPGHWVAISVVRNERGEQAMYLYDNLNTGNRHRDALRRHVENIYNRFFIN